MFRLSGSLDTMLASRQFFLAFILLLYCFSLAFVLLLSWGKTGIICEKSFYVTNNLKIIYCTIVGCDNTFEIVRHLCLHLLSHSEANTHNVQLATEHSGVLSVETNLFAAMLSAGTTWGCIHQQPLP